MCYVICVNTSNTVALLLQMSAAERTAPGKTEKI